MRKIYSMFGAFLFLGTVAHAQVKVTFAVDMNAETVSGNGVHIAGDFQEEAGASGDWKPNETQLTDGNSDGIYEVTVDIPAGYYEFKFINDNNWGAGEESIPAVCQVEEGKGNSNRWVNVYQDTTIATTFAGSAPKGLNFVKFIVDMENEGNGKVPTMSGAFVGWSADGIKLVNNNASGGGTKWATYLYLADGDYEYKYRDTVNWDGKSEAIGSTCGPGNGNRSVTVSGDAILPVYCFDKCDPCTEPPKTTPIKVTLKVDLSIAKVCETFDKVTVAGTFNGWTADDVALTDGDNDDVYEVTLDWETNTEYKYKFQIINSGSVKWEGNVSDRIFMETDTTKKTAAVDVHCFDSEDACGPTPPAAANITFRVDMSKESSPADTIWVIGSFTDPQWQAGALPLTYSGVGGVFETTVEICPESFQYKYTNGDPNSTDNEEFGGEDSVECAESNGLGGFNRKVTRKGGDETLSLFYFSSCEISTVGVDEAHQVGVSLFPNPAHNKVQVNINDINSNYSVILTDLTGKTVVDLGRRSGEQFSINTSDLESGIYLLNIVSVSKQGTAKLIIE